MQLNGMAISQKSYPKVWDVYFDVIELNEAVKISVKKTLWIHKPRFTIFHSQAAIVPIWDHPSKFLKNILKLFFT